jgi:hypothetical protein
MTRRIDRPLHARLTMAHLAETSDIHRFEAPTESVSAIYGLALVFILGVVAGMLIGGLVTL